ncbi:hypothetical protein ACFFGT_30885 [Mucilaginibacter angelicae]|uniref:Uncharacterized protein n=1 Tax=Mucilaginibacter angelicae TaxID=869718 RepID=A0ABV6LGS8_9SPHI
MKISSTIIVLPTLLLTFSLGLKAQTGDAPQIKYRRSSLDIILIESEDFPHKETVIKADKEVPFPDKYNQHIIDAEPFDQQRYSLTEDEKAASKKKSGFMANMEMDLVSNVTSTNIDRSGPYMPLMIDKYNKSNKTANKLVAKWFNRQVDGSFDMKLVGERGQYNASEMEANIAKGTVRGVASLADAGEELIGNTFVVYSKLQFIPNEIVAAAVREAGKTKVSKLPAFLQGGAYKALDVAYEKGKEGYSVWTTSYLYKLRWNDSVAAVFYKDYWMDKNSIDIKRKAAFDNSDLFQLEYVGSAKSSTLVTFKLAKRTEDQIIELATVRNEEEVFAKLQRTYDVFKPKTPLYSGEPITAKIGMKEGLKGGEKFEVLEQTVDPKTGLTEYKRKGTITVDKDQIWDNRFAAGEEVEGDATNISAKTPVDRTLFKGGNKFYAGMLIKQIK